MPTPRGTSNSNVRGNTTDRAKRRAWLMKAYASDVPGLVRCYRCGKLLYNPTDSGAVGTKSWFRPHDSNELILVVPLTIDRIVPGILGGTYAKTNIRPSCQDCATTTGNELKAELRKKNGWTRCAGSAVRGPLDWPADPEEGYPGAAVCICSYGVMARKRSKYATGDALWRGTLLAHEIKQKTDETGLTVVVGMRYTNTKGLKHYD